MKRLISRTGLSIALLCAAAPALAQPALEGKTIVAVHVSGLASIKESVVLGQLKSAAGQMYDQATAERDIVRLDRLGVFGHIALTAVEVDGGVRLDVTLTETPQMIPAIAVAVTDENGASAGPAVKFTSLAGHPVDMSVTTRFGGETLVQFREVSRQLTNRRLWHSGYVSLGDRYNKLDEFDQQSVDVDARAGMRLSEQWLAGGIFQYYGVSSELDGFTLSSDNRDRFTSVGGVTEYDNRDSWREPSRGWFGSADALWRTGTGRYTTVNLDLRRYQPVAARQTFVTTALLTLQSGTDGVDLPTYDDFAIGGENTVRGHSFGSRRGKNQFISTVEYRYSVVPTRTFRVKGINLYAGIALAAFADLGSAWSDPDAFSDGLIGGGGIGLRLYIPYVNMIRLDLSIGNGVHGGLGINEKAVAQRNRVR